MLKTIIQLPDGTEISSGTGSAIAIQKSTITECVNSENELTIGSVCANQFKATIFTPKGQLTIDAGTEVLVLKEDDSGQRYPVGRFILDKPTRASANTFSVTGYDRISKLDKDLSQWLAGLTGWPYSLNSFAFEVCRACGVPFKETDVPNKDFQIQQFTRTAVTGRQLMRWLGEICCSFCRVDREGNIEFSWYSNREIEITHTGNRYYFQNGLTFENYEVAKVDAVQLRLADSENGALWPTAAEGANSYIITGNAILNRQITDDLIPYLEVIKSRLQGATYTPCKVELPASMDIHAGDIVKITDANGKSITTFAMTKTQSGQKDTLESTGSARRDNSGSVNNPTQREQAAEAVNNQTQAELFNKLTDGGKIQGIQMIDGKWYINAETIAAGILRSRDGGVYIDLDNGVGNLARGVSITLTTWDDDTAGFTKDVDTVVNGFLVEQIQTMKENTIRDFAVKLYSAQRYPEAAKLTIFTYRKYSGSLAASISFEWTDGSRSHKTATEEVYGWSVEAMEWL